MNKVYFSRTKISDQIMISHKLSRMINFLDKIRISSLIGTTTKTRTSAAILIRILHLNKYSIPTSDKISVQLFHQIRQKMRLILIMITTGPSPLLSPMYSIPTVVSLHHGHKAETNLQHLTSSLNTDLLLEKVHPNAAISISPAT